MTSGHSATRLVEMDEAAGRPSTADGEARKTRNYMTSAAGMKDTNQYNQLGKRLLTRQSVLYRMHMGGNQVGRYLGKDEGGQHWNVRVAQGAFDGKNFRAYNMGGLDSERHVQMMGTGDLERERLRDIEATEAFWKVPGEPKRIAGPASSYKLSQPYLPPHPQEPVYPPPPAWNPPDWWGGGV